MHYVMSLGYRDLISLISVSLRRWNLASQDNWPSRWLRRCRLRYNLCYIFYCV